jgi:glucose/arabinose dehydrogenase/PKD repeat protein
LTLLVGEHTLVYGRGAMRSRVGRVAALFVVSVSMLVVPPGQTPLRAAPAPTDGFEDSLVASIPSPTALAFTPDGHLLIATQKGEIWIKDTAGGDPKLGLDLGASVCSDRDQGMLGMTVDPSFYSNGYIYASYTFNKSGDCTDITSVRRVNRVSRFTVGHENQIDPASEHVLFDNIPAPDEGLHSNADLAFGPDGLLYVSLGDGGCDFRGGSGCQSDNDSARDLGLPLGKILRIQADGGLPPDNPFVGPNSVRCNESGFTEVDKVCAEIYSYGLRNPYRITFDPVSGQMLINDVGLGTWEEIDVGEAGADYGWNIREGQCLNEGDGRSVQDCGTEPPGMTNPFLQYGRNEGCTAITGGTFAPAGLWPSRFDHHYLFSDLACGRIFVMDSGLTGSSMEPALNVVGFPVDLAFGPHGDGHALYYATRVPDEVRVITYVGDANRTPLAEATATPNAGSTPLEVRFDATRSTDPDSDDLTFDWDFGDGSPHSAEDSPEHVYATPGTYLATVAVNDPDGATATRTIRIDPGNDAPTAQIRSSTIGNRYRLREPLTFTGRATDRQDGALPAGALSWEVLLHHNTHTHTYVPSTSGDQVELVAPGHDETAPGTHVHLETRLTATDSSGVTTTVSRDFSPVQGTELLSGPSGPVATRSATFQFISRDFEGTFECALDQEPMSPCTSPVSFGDVPEGDHTFKVQATDSHGGVDATPISRTWKVDLTPPESMISSGPSGATATRDTAFEFSSNDPEATFECSFDGGAWAVCGSPIRYADLLEGQHTFGVRAKDPAGNVEPSPSVRSWTVDITPPDTTITSGPSGTTASRSARIEFLASEAGAGFRCSLDGSPLASCISPTNYQGLVDGTHVFAVAAVDNAGNIDPNAATIGWAIDGTAPPAPTIAVGDGDRFVLSESFEIRWEGTGDSYDVELSDQQWTGIDSVTEVWLSRTTGNSTSFVGEPGHAYCFRARAYDELGNVSGWGSRSCTALPVDDVQIAKRAPASWSRERDARHYTGTALVTRATTASLVIPLPSEVKHVEALVEMCRRCGRVKFIVRSPTGPSRSTFVDLSSPERRSRVLVPIHLTTGRPGSLLVRVTSPQGRMVRLDGIAIDTFD